VLRRAERLVDLRDDRVDLGRLAAAASTIARLPLSRSSLASTVTNWLTLVSRRNSLRRGAAAERGVERHHERQHELGAQRQPVIAIAPVFENTLSHAHSGSFVGPSGPSLRRASAKSRL